jgi:hypothetical protein
MQLRTFRWLVPLGLVVLLVPACSDSANGADTTAAPTTTVIETTTTAASEDGPVGLSADQLPPSVAAFKTAYESGDLETVKGIFTDDGIITTTDKTFDLYYGRDYWLGKLDKNGSEFERLASIHSGEMFITDVIEVGERAVAFAWAWEDFASGTAILHLRGDQIVVAVLAVTEFDIPPEHQG